MIRARAISIPQILGVPTPWIPQWKSPLNSSSLIVSQLSPTAPVRVIENLDRALFLGCSSRINNGHRVTALAIVIMGNKERAHYYPLLLTNYG